MSFIERYKKISPQIAFSGMLLMVVSLFFSRFLISIGVFIVIANTLFERNYKEKFRYIIKNPYPFLIVLLLVFHLIALFYTENLKEGLNDIRLKSYLLLILFYGTGAHLNPKQKNLVFKTYIAASVLAALTSIYRFHFVMQPAGIEDLRGIAFVGDNLYQAIFINFAIVLAIYLYIHYHRERILYISAIILYIYYLFLLNSLTGYVLFIVILLFSAVYFLFQPRYRKKAIKLSYILIIIFLAFTIYILKTVNDFYRVDKIDYSALPQKTINGNNYLHDTSNTELENGHYIYWYVCEKELIKEWNQRANIRYDSLDKKNQQIKYTILRYLSSKNLTKDSLGIWKLSPEDIRNIENGYANYLYTDNFSLKARIFLIIWQIDRFINQNYADRQSISQRLVYIKIALRIIKDNLLIGVAPGDVHQITQNYFQKEQSGLSPEYFNVVHNQFILEFVALGLWGGLGFLFLFFYPFFKLKLWKDFLFTSFFVIIVFSFMAEFLLETQLGITFFSIFYALLIFKE